jgi:hypothetical protein
MEFPVVKYKGSLWLVIDIDGDDYTTCINKNGDVDSIGMASYSLPLEEALKKESFCIVDHQTIKEFRLC